MVCKAKVYIFDHSFTFSSLRNDRKMDKKMCRALGKSRARGDQNHIYIFLPRLIGYFKTYFELISFLREVLVENYKSSNKL